MQSYQQKQLQIFIDSTFNDNYQNFSSHAEQIIKFLSSRVDMPKHFINLISKKLAVKEQQKISIIFDLLWFVTQNYENKIALFNQISGNKQFLLKISSILSLKDLNSSLKLKIVDIIYQWKEMFKENKELFTNFWSFFANFEKKGYVPSNLNFQTRYQKQMNPKDNQQTVQQKNQPLGLKETKDIFELIEGQSVQTDFRQIQRQSLLLFFKVLEKLIIQNKIISNTSPDMMDVPPILKENMADLKIMEDKVDRQIFDQRRVIGEHKNQVTIDTAMNLIKMVHLTEKRYTELITKYLPQQFELSSRLVKFQNFCNQNQLSLNLREPLKNQFELLDLQTGVKKPSNNNLLDLQIPSNTNDTKKQQAGVKNFFGNLLDKVNATRQAGLSNQPIENDFKTDVDLIAYKDPKTVKQHLDRLKNITAEDLFKF